MFGEQDINFKHTLCFAIQAKDIQMIRFLLGNNNESFEYKNQLGETLIHIAVKNNFKELIDWLVCEGLGIDSVDCSNRTALHLAVSTKNEDMIQYLLNYAANINSKDLYGKSPFHMAIQLGNTRLVELFLLNGANVLDVTSNTHQTAFHIALKNEDEEIFILLLKHYIGNINVSDVYGETLLHMLARQKHEHLAKLLITRGADLEMINKDSETALHFAIHNRNFRMSKLFIEAGANVNVKNKYGESPLHLSIRYKDLRLVNLLLTNNADINERTSDFDTMLHVAINYFNQDILNLLLEHDIDVENRNSCDLDPFHLAIKNKCLDGAKILLNKGIDVNSIAFGKLTGNHQKEIDHIQMFTSLDTAIIQKDIDTVKFLLENGVRLDLNNDHEIFLAVEIGCSNIVEQLIKYGANVNAVNSMGQSLLYSAMKIRNKEEVQTLLHYGAKLEFINETNIENETALHLAVKAKDEKFVQFLLDIGIDVNICNANDSTALCFAYGSTGIANLLITKIALLKVNNFFVSQRNEIIIDMVQEFNSYYLKCIRELLEIKTKKCFNIALMNFLIKDVFVLAKFVRRKAVVVDFQASVDSNRYPIYFKKLVENMERAIERCNLLCEAKGLLCLSTFFESLYDALDEIVDNFSSEELRCLIEKFK